MPEVKRYCPGLPVLLVGCKTDLRQDQKTIQELEKQSLKPITAHQVCLYMFINIYTAFYSHTDRQYRVLRRLDKWGLINMSNVLRNWKKE